MKIEIELDDKALINQIREDNRLLTEDLSDDEVLERVQELADEISTVAGFSMVVENLDYFND